MTTYKKEIQFTSDELAEALTSSEKAIAFIQRIADGSEKTEEQPNNSKLFSLDEFKHNSDRRNLSISIFYQMTQTLDLSSRLEQQTVIKELDQETQKYIAEKGFEKILNHLKKDII